MDAYMAAGPDRGARRTRRLRRGRATPL